jgi:hypothetical protein
MRQTKQTRQPAPRNSLCLLSPPQNNVDFTLGKIFKVAERQNLRFAEFFNLQSSSFANLRVTNGGTAVGLAPITPTIGTPRLIPLSLKYAF